jgi:hypothetical protein
MVIVGVMVVPGVGRAPGAAGIAAAIARACHPLTHGVSAAVIADDLIGRINGAPAGSVTDNTAGTVIATIVRLRFGRQRDTQGGESSEDGEYSFHDGV